jgi:hypothetical protein
MTNRANDQATPSGGSPLSFDDAKRVFDSLPVAVRAQLRDQSIAISQDVVAVVREHVVNQVEVSARSNVQADILRGGHRDIRNRILDELGDLQRRNYFNLAVGATLCITGIVYLIFFADTVPSSQSGGFDYVLMATLLRSGATAALIELFAFFFLRLYRQGLGDIKYYQNELTTLDSVFLSLHASIFSGEMEFVKSQLVRLVKIDRNSVLAKGQTTADLEREKARLTDNDAAILQGVAAVLNATKTKDKTK